MTPQRVIRVYLALAGLYTLSTSLIWGVNTLFLLHAGLDIGQVFVANAASTAAMVVFEIPTGVVADTIGRRPSFLASIAVLAGATALYAVAGVGGAGLGVFVLVSVLLGLGFTFYSGAMEAWLVDALAATGYDGTVDHVFSRGQAVTAAAMLVGTLAGGFLGAVDLALPFVLRAVLLVPVFAIGWLVMHDVGFAPRPLSRATFVGEMRAVASASVTYGLRHRQVRLLMLVPFVQLGFFAWAWYAWQPYFLGLLERDEVWIAGVISACLSLATIIGNGIVEWLTRFCGRRTTVLLWGSAVQTIAAVTVGLSGSFAVAFGALAVYSAAAGVIGPVKQAYLHAIIPSEQRATLVSLDSLVGNVGSVGGQIGLGALSRDRGIGDGYVLGGAVTVLALPLVLVLRRIGGTADRIVGTAGVRGPCAGQGLPAPAAVDTTPRRAGALEPVGAPPGTP